MADIKPDVFLPTADDNLDNVDDNYQSWADDLPNVKLHSKTGTVLEDISDADTIDYTYDTQFVKKVPKHPRDRLKSKIKRKITKKQKNNKKSKQKTNTSYC